MSFRKTTRFPMASSFYAETSKSISGPLGTSQSISGNLEASQRISGHLEGSLVNHSDYLSASQTMSRQLKTSQAISGHAQPSQAQPMKAGFKRVRKKGEFLS